MALNILLISCGQDNYTRTIKQTPLAGNIEPILGCTNINADNYNSKAEYENYACVFSGCMNSDYLNYDKDLNELLNRYLEKASSNNQQKDLKDIFIEKCNGIKKCNSNLGSNYDPNNLNPGACNFEVCLDARYDNYIGKDKEKEINDYIAKYPKSKIINTCQGLLGCTESLAQNYNKDAEVDLRNCQFNLCLVEGYSETLNKTDLDRIKKYLMDNPLAKNTSSCINLLGCTFKDAINYDPLAKADNNQCVINICADANYKEYNKDLIDRANAHKNQYAGTTINDNLCQTPKVISQNRSMPLSKTSQTTNNASVLHIVFDDSKSMTPLNNKMIDAIKNSASALTQTNQVTLKFYLQSSLSSFSDEYLDPVEINGMDKFYIDRVMTYKTRQPFGEVEVNSNMSNTEIKDKISYAIRNLKVNVNFKQERSLCAYAIWLTEAIKNADTEHQAFVLISNENAYEQVINQMDGTRCLLKRVVRDHYEKRQVTYQNPGRLEYLRVYNASFQLIMKYYDENGEEYNIGKNQYIGSSQIFTRGFWNSLQSLKRYECTPEMIAEIKVTHNLDKIDECQYTKSETSGVIRKSYYPEIFALQVEDPENNFCSQRDVTIKGKYYPRLLDYIFETQSRWNDDTYTRCNYYPHIPGGPPEIREQTVRYKNETIEVKNLKTEYDVDDMINASVKILTHPSVSEKVRKNITTVLYAFDENDTADCSQQELSTMGHGKAYLDIIQLLEGEKLNNFWGNVCESDYSQKIAQIINKITSQGVELKYLLANWSEKVISNSVEVIIKNAQNSLKLNANQFSITKEADKYYLNFSADLEETLLEYDSIEINYQVEN